MRPYLSSTKISKKLSKRFRTLEKDFAILKQYLLEVFHKGIKTDDPVEISGACRASYKSYKVSKFACKFYPEGVHVPA